MSDNQSSESATTPAASAAPTPVTPSAAPASPPSPPANAAPPTDPEKYPPPWLKDRLAEEREKAQRAVLKDLGVDDVEAVKAVIAKQRAEDEKNKTLAQKYAEEQAKAKAYQDQVAELSKAVDIQARTAMASLTPEQRTAVVALAGDSSSKQIQVIDALRPSWGTTPTTPSASSAPAAQAPAQTPVPAVPAPRPAIPAPANTTAAPSAPAAKVPPEENPLAMWEYLKVHQPMRAATFRLEHGAAIEAAQRARNSA